MSFGYHDRLTAKHGVAFQAVTPVIDRFEGMIEFAYHELCAVLECRDIFLGFYVFKPVAGILGLRLTPHVTFHYYIVVILVEIS